MIFDRNYDLALLCMMKADKKNKQDIQKFISEIPTQLMDNIRIALEQVKKGEFVFDGETSDFFHVESPKSPRVYYMFSLYEDGRLKISEELYTGTWEDELFDLEIYPIDLEVAKKMGRSSSQRLGSVLIGTQTDEIFPDIPCYEYTVTSYDLCKAPIGHYVRFERTKENKKVRPINMKKASEELTEVGVLRRG